jgi:hypothetical protein
MSANLLTNTFKTTGVLKQARYGRGHLSSVYVIIGSSISLKRQDVKMRSFLHLNKLLSISPTLESNVADTHGAESDFLNL